MREGYCKRTYSITDKALKRASDRVSKNAFDPHRIPDALTYQKKSEQRKERLGEKHEE